MIDELMTVLGIVGLFSLALATVELDPAKQGIYSTICLASVAFFFICAILISI